MLTKGPFYDDSLAAAVRVMTGRLDDNGTSCTYLRDGQGRVHVYIPTAISDDELHTLEVDLRAALGGYAPTHGPVAHAEVPSGEAAFLVVGDRRVRYIERRFAGADWGQKPTPPATTPGRLVFYSIKGGVGRTTALSALATALAGVGRRILAVDFDLEAPGLGAALLNADDLPEFGALDWLTEYAVQSESLPSLDKVVATSTIGRDTGLIDVVPAFGKRCLAFPASVLSKLSRIVVEGGAAGPQATFGLRVRQLIDALVAYRSYDAVLIDARAGLSELSAAPLTGLGADVLFFMSDNSQSISSYTALLAHLQRFAPLRSSADGDDDWRLRLKIVRARVANSDPERTAVFNDRCYDMFTSTIYDAEEDADDVGAFAFDPDDPNAPHFPIQIAFDPRYQIFEPLIYSEQVSMEVAAPAFGSFIAWCSERLQLDDRI